MSPKFFFISMLYSLIFTQYSCSQCLDNQKSLLLQLKKELIFYSPMSVKLVQWNQSNECCKWYGVECDGAGYVISLQLDDEYISGGIGDSSSLFRLKHLEKLNLAYNDFNSAQIPRGIHNLTYLTHLNLSHASFVGQVPAEISSLRRLISLDISDHPFPMYPMALKFQKPNLETFLRNLTGLRELYLNGVDIISNDESRKHWSHIISSYLPNLTALSLKRCSLSGPLANSFWQLRSLSILRLDHNDLSTVVPEWLTNFQSLTTLSLSSCSLNGTFLEMFFQVPTLQNLDLSHNDFLSGSMPSTISNLKTLSIIDLSSCRFTGPIPSTFANLTQLIYVDLSFNMFTGSLSSTMFEGLSNLAYLNLDKNSFSGKIPRSLFGLPSLLELGLHHNQFSGQVEEFSTVNVSNIVSLRLEYNRLEGPIPDYFFQLQSLQTLSLSGNLFNGTFQMEKIQNLVNLTVLELSYNNLSIDLGNDSSSSYGFPQLDILNLASCNMHDFPHFIKHSDRMYMLDLSNNQISGEIPNWIWGTQLHQLNLSFNLLTHVQKPYHIPPSLEDLDLHSNQLREELHLLFPHNSTTSYLYYFSLGNNSLSGSIPTSLCRATQLKALDLSVNKLSGTIPSCLFDGPIGLEVLDLGRNNISGHIPDSFTPSCRMTYFDVNNNTIEGRIPKSLERCERLEFMNVGNNIINDTFPCMRSSRLRVLVLHSNRFHAEVKCHNNRWPVLQIIDISSNNFSGSLQSVNFSSWKGMALNNDAKRRHNHSGSDSLQRSIYDPGAGVRIIMKGQEVEIVKIWPDFTLIDFSCNKFQGEIPNAIGDLNSLHLLNLSHNALNGSIPKSFAKMGDLESLDLSQNQLAGHIPVELERLTFLSFLNLSYNKLAGVIPKGSQFQTFPADSFKGNSELCGFPLKLSCTNTNENSTPPRENENVQSKREIQWEYVSAALGYAVGLGSFVWLLIFCRRFREKYFGKIDEVVEEMFDARERRRRRRSHARRVARREVMIRNPVRRQ